MAAPAVVQATQLGKSFYVTLAELITIASNASIPIATDSAQTGVLSGATATLIIAALNAQRDLV